MEKINPEQDPDSGQHPMSIEQAESELTKLEEMLEDDPLLINDPEYLYNHSRLVDIIEGRHHLPGIDYFL